MSVKKDAELILLRQTTVFLGIRWMCQVRDVLVNVSVCRGPVLSISIFFGQNFSNLSLLIRAGRALTR
jgi:hypothetical protein